MNEVKFSLFSDLHHYPGVFRSNTPENLFRIQQRAKENNVDFIIHCGDLTHVPAKEREFLSLYNDFEIPSYHCLGNHDTDGTPLAEVLRLYKMPNMWYHFDVKGFRFIVLDTNYLYHEGEYLHFDCGNYYPHGGERDWMPPEELDYLRDTLESAPGPCVLFNHSSFERCDGVQNRDAVRKVINDANEKHHNRVLLSVNGHFHRDALTILDNVAYFEINSASYDWVEKAHDKYPPEECAKISLLNHTVCYNDPVHAIVTMREDGEIDIEGMSSTMLYGINREHTENAVYDRMGRPVVPKVSDYHFRLM